MKRRMKVRMNGQANGWHATMEHTLTCRTGIERAKVGMEPRSSLICIRETVEMARV